MSLIIDGVTYYRMTEACKMAGISRGTYYRWLNGGFLRDTKCRDRRGWRLFEKDDISRIKTEAMKIQEELQPNPNM